MPPRQGPRQAFALLAVALCGYFSLGTSCDDEADHVATELFLEFQPGQESALLTVRAVSSSLALLFDDVVLVPHRPEATVPPDGDAGHGGRGGAGGSVGSTPPTSVGSESAVPPWLQEDVPLVDADPAGQCDLIGSPPTTTECRFDPEPRRPNAEFDLYTVRVFRDPDSADTAERIGLRVQAWGFTGCSGEPAELAIHAEQAASP